jgi:superfamily I DNA/RNA helicase
MSAPSPTPDPVEPIRQFILQELDHFTRFRPDPRRSRTFIDEMRLTSEPFIGYLEVEGPPEYKSLLICRNYTPSEFKAKHPDTDFVSYLAPVGRIISHRVGETANILVPSNIPGRPRTVSLKLVKRNAGFRPEKHGGVWDALRNDISWVGGQRFVASLRAYVADEARPLRREVVDRVQLPDQAILDDAQDIIFREPLTRFLIISGAPGTGKTTVLIKRLAQKTKYEFLSDEEKRAVSATNWQENRNWVLFTPNDLLKNYVKEALGKEHLPATDDTVRVWSEYRTSLLRDINFLKAGSSGYFQRVPNGQLLVKRGSNADATALTKAFREDLALELDEFYREEYRKFGDRVRPQLTALRGGMQQMMERALDYLTGALKGDEQQANPLEVGAEFRSKAQKIEALIRYAEALIARGDRKGAAPLTPDSARQFQQEVVRRLPEMTRIDIPAHVFPELPRQIDDLRDRIRDLAEATTFNAVFARIPQFFHAFRTSEAGSKFYRDDATTDINTRKVDAIEMDALLWVALDFAASNESVVNESAAQKGESSRAKFLLDQRQGMIAVDEATDFSAVELGCMHKLSSPAFESFTVCGDPMQRLTTHGIQDWEDVKELAGSFHLNILQRSYRQTARLLAVAADLYRHTMEKDPPFESAYQLVASDPPPLAFKARAGETAEAWIAERIVEIWEANKHQLPSIGIFVPEASDEATWVNRLAGPLEENSIDVEGSGQGTSLGNTHRVRVFPVSKIKGLEFEAAFFVDIDRMADMAPDLIERYLYVGLSRARSYLAVTYSTQFPRRLSGVRKHFADQRAFSVNEAEVQL